MRWISLSLAPLLREAGVQADVNVDELGWVVLEASKTRWASGDEVVTGSGKRRRLGEGVLRRTILVVRVADLAFVVVKTATPPR